MLDVVIIGAGVIGSSVARALSRYDLKVAVVERGDDVCSGTSKANSGLVHAGFDAKPGSLNARMNVEGAAMMPGVCKELDVPFTQPGALVVATSEEEKTNLQALYDQGIANGVSGLKILSGDEVRTLEPNVSDAVCGALYAETAGIVCPFTLTIAMAENANVNGVEFFFNQNVDKVEKVKTHGGYYRLYAKDTVYEAKCIVNCAGVYSDVLHNMVSEKKYHITPRRGEYCLLDHNAIGFASRTIFKVPGPMGKGILVTPTAHGNILLGPTAEDVDDKDDVATTAAGIDKIYSALGASVKNVPVRQVITGFSGLRAHEDGGDFIIEEAADAPGWIDAVGIESPGLSSAPAIAKRIEGIVTQILKPSEKKDFISCRRGIVMFLELPAKEQKKLLSVRPEYGTIVCRCEMITEGEILDAIYRPLGATSMDGIKRRVRAGMGRCQGGFCSPRVAELLANAQRCSLDRITKRGPGSELLAGPKGEAIDTRKVKGHSGKDNK